MKDKAEYPMAIEKSQFEFLSEIAKKYSLPDESKALRCLINYAIEEQGARDTIFQQIRCLDC